MRHITIAIVVCVAAATFVRIATAHACYESTDGSGQGIKCGPCGEEGHRGEHRFSDGTTCNNPNPCNYLGRNTTEGFCKDFDHVWPYKPCSNDLPPVSTGSGNPPLLP